MAEKACGHARLQGRLADAEAEYRTSSPLASTPRPDDPRTMESREAINDVLTAEGKNPKGREPIDSFPVAEDQDQVAIADRLEREVNNAEAAQIYPRYSHIAETKTRPEKSGNPRRRAPRSHGSRGARSLPSGRKLSSSQRSRFITTCSTPLALPSS